MSNISKDDFLILLTDDDEDDREIFQDTLEEVDDQIKLLTLNDGVQLMEYLCANGNRLPDILFLDINMPHKDGHQSLREIRADPRLKDLCVIIYSTSDYPQDVKKAYRTGANGFIQKPSNHKKLKEILHNVVTTDWKNPSTTLEELTFVLKP